MRPSVPDPATGPSKTEYAAYVTRPRQKAPTRRGRKVWMIQWRDTPRLPPSHRRPYRRWPLSSRQATAVQAAAEESEGRSRRRWRGALEGAVVVRRPLHPCCDRFDGDLPMQRLFLSRNIEAQRSRPERRGFRGGGDGGWARGGTSRGGGASLLRVCVEPQPCAA